MHSRRQVRPTRAFERGTPRLAPRCCEESRLGMVPDPTPHCPGRRPAHLRSSGPGTEGRGLCVRRQAPERWPSRWEHILLRGRTKTQATRDRLDMVYVGRPRDCGQPRMQAATAIARLRGLGGEQGPVHHRLEQYPFTEGHREAGGEARGDSPKPCDPRRRFASGFGRVLDSENGMARCQGQTPGQALRLSG